MKCPKCGAEGKLYNDQSGKGYRIWVCPNWENKTCDYGSFGEFWNGKEWVDMKNLKEIFLNEKPDFMKRGCLIK